MSEDLTAEQVALVERGGSVLNGLTNVAPGTPGWNVRELARKGVWSLLRKDSRLGMAIHLTHDAKWPISLQERLKAIRKALGNDGENLQWKRNQAVHGVHKSSGAPESFSLTIPRERGDKREMDVSISDLHSLVTRLIELVADAGGVFEEYGHWKFGTGGQQSLQQDLAQTKPTLRIIITNYLESAVKRLLGNH